MEIITGKCPFSAVSCFEFVMTTGIYNGRITALLIQLRLCSPILKYHLVGNNGFNNKSLRII